MTPSDFVQRLSAIRMPSVFNPYSDICTIYDLPDAAARRRSNLTSMLETALKLKVETLWIGRDLGHRGGRRTGIALTDEANMPKLFEAYRGKIEIQRATKGPILAERTASVVWELIEQMDKPVFTWNVFPLHPHPLDDELGNRCHTVGERVATAPLLKALIEILRPTQIVAIGNDASVGLASMGIASVKVRHPSYGGVADFRNGIATLHRFVDAPPNKHPQLLFQ